MKFADVSEKDEIRYARDCVFRMDFKELNGYDVSTILSVPFFSWDKGEIKLINCIKDVIKSLFLVRNTTLGFDDKILFFESLEYMDRRAYRQMYEKVEECVEKKTIIRPRKQMGISKGLWKYLFLWLDWKRQLKRAVKDTRISWFLSLNLLKAYIELDKFRKELNGFEPRVIVTFCDVHPVDAMVVQWAKINLIKTVTLQHGHFNASDRGWVFSRSKSDFFFLQGEYARQEALLCGKSENGLIVAGMMNFIGSERKEIHPIEIEKNVFAVLLNGPGAKEDNDGFLKCADDIAEKYGLKYVVRTHPNLSNQNYFSSKYCCGESKQVESIEDLVGRTQFVLVGNSTMFIESLYIGGAAFRYKGLSQDIYDRIRWCAFNNITEFGIIYENCISHPDSFVEQVSKSVEQLCAPGNIASNYAKAFEKIVKEEIG